jgi:diacylglycerol O-acyltransferase-1
MRHIYNPMRRKKIHKFFCGAAVWAMSAFFHEYIISGALGKIHYSAFIAMMSNFPISIIQNILKHAKVLNDTDGTALNVMFWVSFCFLGQPLCIVLYFYSYSKDHPQFLLS